MEQDVQIDFGVLAGQIAEAARSPYLADDVPRTVGLSFIVELAAKTTGTRAFWAGNTAAMLTLLQAAFFEMFDRHFPIFTGPGVLPAGRLQVQTLAVPELVAQSPHLGRFLTMRVAGVTLETLNALLQSRYPQRNPNAYDFAYDLAARLNLVLHGRDAPVAVARVDVDPPFQFTCHKVAPDQPGWWPHDDHHMDFYSAWQLPPPAGGKNLGEGMLIGHLDTGWSHHQAYVNIGARLRYDLQFNATDSTPNAQDPLVKTDFNSEPGHGTTTATIIVSGTPDNPPKAFDDPTGVLGTATRADIVPILVCQSTAFVYNSFVARGLTHAMAKNCHVVSMSIGGFLVTGFKQIAMEANARNMLLIAAAGNCVWPVIYPARFSECLAVGGSTKKNKYWVHAPDDFCVDLAAPCDDVRTTHIENGMPGPPYQYNNGSGTSYSTAYMAGLAALWRGFFYGSGPITNTNTTPLQTTFAKSAKTHVDLPPHWDSSFHGSGIANARKLLHDGPDFELHPGDRVFAANPLAAPELDSAAAPGALPSMPLREIDDAQFRLQTLTELLYQNAADVAAMLAVARRWFAAQSDEETLKDIDRYGGEMVNLFIDAGKKDDFGHANPLSKTTAKRLLWALQIYKTQGSSALRDAIHA